MTEPTIRHSYKMEPRVAPPPHDCDGMYSYSVAPDGTVTTEERACSTCAPFWREQFARAAVDARSGEQP